MILLARGGDVGAHGQEAPAPCFVRQQPEISLQLDYPDVLLGQVVGEAHAEVVCEAQRLLLPGVQAQQQVLGVAALDPLVRVLGQPGVRS